MRRLRSLLLMALLPAAAAAQSPPYTRAFEHSLAAYGDCIRGAVDRYDLSSVSFQRAGAGAVASCSVAYEVVVAQLASDFAARDRLRPERARAAAQRALRRLAPNIERMAVEFARERRSRIAHAQDR